MNLAKEINKDPRLTGSLLYSVFAHLDLSAEEKVRKAKRLLETLERDVRDAS